MSDIQLPSSTPPLALAIVNARVWTGDPRRPWADALFVRAGRIDTLGSSAEVRKRSGAATKVIDARGLMLMSSRQAGVLARGGLADLILIDRPLDQVSVGAPNDAEIVLTIEAGRIVTDRDSLTR